MCSVMQSHDTARVNCPALPVAKQEHLSSYLIVRHHKPSVSATLILIVITAVVITIIFTNTHTRTQFRCTRDKVTNFLLLLYT